MAKFRKNHQSAESFRGKSSGLGKKSAKYLIWFFLILGLMYLLTGVDIDSWQEGSGTSREDKVTISSEKLTGVSTNYLPTSTTGDVIQHQHYTLSYSEDHEQSEWVAYKLTKENLKKKRVPRAKKFKPDNSISTTSAYHKDYSHSGYTRGHLAPAGDMSFSQDAMRESFLMSNMSPQVKELNGGIWRELEETVRDWAYDYGELYVVSGPILSADNIVTTIGRNNVSVPKSFYKIVLYNDGKNSKAAAFIMPNEKSTKKIADYQVTIDEIESITGIDFFADFLAPEIENQVESSKDRKSWKYKQKRYKTRINKWNNY